MWACVFSVIAITMCEKSHNNTQKGAAWRQWFLHVGTRGCAVYEGCEWCVGRDGPEWLRTFTNSVEFFRYLCCSNPFFMSYFAPRLNI